MDHAEIADTISDFTPGKQLARVFRYHQELQNARHDNGPVDLLR
jgi:hypothetical protein